MRPSRRAGQRCLTSTCWPSARSACRHQIGLGVWGFQPGVLLTSTQTFAPTTIPDDYACQPAGAGTHFIDCRIFERAGRSCNAPRQVEIEQKILAERFAGDETVPANDLAQWRQAIPRGIRRAAHEAARAAAPGAAASRAASRNAAMRLVGSARPVPAMSKAVP